MVKNGGWVTVIGLWGHDFKVNLDRVPYNNLTVRGSWGWAGMEVADQAVRMAMGWHSWERALQIMAHGQGPVGADRDAQHHDGRVARGV